MEAVGIIGVSALVILASVFAGAYLARLSLKTDKEIEKGFASGLFKKKIGKRKPTVRDDLHAWAKENERELPRDV